MAMEVPILCTDLRVFSRMTECGQFVQTIADNRPTTIADGIELAWKNLESLKRAAPDGREIVKRAYGWKAVAGELDRFLTTVVTS
jgi:hypothetical protein